MSVYLIVYGILIACWIIIKFSDSKKAEKLLYYFCLLILWLFLILRYGQGSDYFGYKYIFYGLNNIQEAITNPFDRHSEIGFRLLCALFGKRYELFVAAIGSFNMIMIHRCIKRYSDDWLLSLIIFFPTYYLTYLFSALRQSIVFSVFVGAMLECIEKNRIKKYYLICALLCTIHSVSILYALIPLILKIKIKGGGSILYLPIFALGFGFVLGIVGHSFFAMIPLLGPKLAPYINSSVSWMGLVERLVSYYVAALLYLSIAAKKRSPRLQLWMVIYSIGAIFYFAFFPMPTIAARSCMLFKGVEMLLFVKLIKEKAQLKQFAALYFVSLSVFMTFKNINSYIDQGKYNESVTVFNYPYFTIFHEHEDLLLYRGTDKSYEWLAKNGYE